MKEHAKRIKEKQNRMKKLFHWHKDKICDLYVLLNDLSKRTKENLNKIGVYSVEVNFHAEVKSKISIKIAKTESK